MNYQPDLLLIQSCLGGRGRLPARGSRSPVRACINAYGSSDHGLAALGSHMCHPSLSTPSVDGFAIRHPCVDTLLNVDASSVGPSAGSMFRRPPSLRRVVLDRDCPGFIGTTRTLRLPVVHPTALRFPSLGGTTVAPVALLPRGDRRTPPGRGVVEGGHPNAAESPWR